jgi:membrane protein implicated in regulation of membrane protease activity
MKAILARLVIVLALICMALLIVASTVCLFEAALYVALAKILPPAAALALTGTAALIAVLIIALAIRLSLPTRGRKKRGSGMPEDELVEAATALLGRTATDKVRAHPWESSLGALAAGLAVGYSPRLRRILKALLLD